MPEIKVESIVEVIGDNRIWEVKLITRNGNCTLKQINGECYKTAPMAELKLIKKQNAGITVGCQVNIKHDRTVRRWTMAAMTADGEYAFLKSLAAGCPKKKVCCKTVKASSLKKTRHILGHNRPSIKSRREIGRARKNK